MSLTDQKDIWTLLRLEPNMKIYLNKPKSKLETSPSSSKQYPFKILESRQNHQKDSN